MTAGTQSLGLQQKTPKLTQHTLLPTPHIAVKPPPPAQAGPYPFPLPEVREDGREGTGQINLGLSPLSHPPSSHSPGNQTRPIKEKDLAAV